MDETSSTEEREAAAAGGEAGAVARRAVFLRVAKRVGVPLPDALMAIVLALAASTHFAPVEWLGFLASMGDVQSQLQFALMVEGGFLMMQGALVDIATRLRKRPPIWAIPIIAAGLLLFSPHARNVLIMAREQGLVVLVPLLISLAERFSALWKMPAYPQIRKIAERVLISNRIFTGIVLFGVVTAIMLIGVATGRDMNFHGQTLAAASLYFAVAAFDEWRVRGARFAERPSTLFPYDVLGMKFLDPL